MRIGADHVIAHLHAAGGGALVLAGLSGCRAGRGRGLLRLGKTEQVRRDGIGDDEPRGDHQKRGVQQVGVAEGARRQGKGQEEGRAGDAGEGAQVSLRGGGEALEGTRRGGGGRQGQERGDGEGGEGVGQALSQMAY